MFGEAVVQCPYSLLQAGLAHRGGARKPMRTAIVNAVNDVALESARDATLAGLIEPVLVGDFGSIQAAAESIGWDIGIYQVIDVAGEDASAEAGAMAAGRGEVDALMKGHLHTDSFMKAVLNKPAGLRLGKPLTSRLTCHIAWARRIIDRQRCRLDHPARRRSQEGDHHQRCGLGARARDRPAECRGAVGDGGRQREDPLDG